MKKIIILFIFLISCAFANDAMDRALDSWKGENIDNVIRLWGYPTKEENIANRHLFRWELDYGIKYTSYGTAYRSFCNRTLEVDSSNIVINYQWSGNSCPITAYTVKPWVNPNHNYWKDKKIEKAKVKYQKQLLKQK